jgi:hypothetical protein
MHGTVGGIVAGSVFVIPSVFVLIFLSSLAVAYSEVPAITGLLYGLQPVVVAVVLEAVLRIGKRTLHHAALLAELGSSRRVGPIRLQDAETSVLVRRLTRMLHTVEHIS